MKFLDHYLDNARDCDSGYHGQGFLHPVVYADSEFGADFGPDVPCGC